MAEHEDLAWILDLDEQERAGLHRLACLLGAEEHAEDLVLSALISLHRRGHRLIDPQERVEYLREQVVHLARPWSDGIAVPDPEDTRHLGLVETLRRMPHQLGEILVVSHYLGVFGPELSRVMRLTLRGTNQRLEQALQQLTDETDPDGQVEATSQSLADALRESASTIKVPVTSSLEEELRERQRVPHRGRVRGHLVAVASIVALAMGAVIAVLTQTPETGTDVEPSATPVTSAEPSVPVAIPAVVRDAPIHFVGRTDGKLYREYRNLPATSSLLRSGVEALFTLVPNDPDYKSMWQGQVNDVQRSGGIVTVDLGAASYEQVDPGMTRAAVDQVVYTVTDLLGNPDLRVRFLADGGAPPAAFRAERGFGRSGLGPMPGLWITAPSNQDTVPLGTLTVEGTSKPEFGAPTVTITNADTKAQVSKSIAQTTLNANADGWLVWSVSLPIDEPGTYEVVATATSTKSTGSGPAPVVSENKTVRVSTD
ncbi:GerMN domain-containing protein [uncultured Tessaracoccus sp.]|uniref:GerMN domain-containing protein n=1 Tax=uncultured Tessaracoccus sp. TaxID=905023 RepID=UPI0025E24A7B|nr:GerMN domain-containing protein [uncultured Tessaracoccus sp.]